jgi:hypothetical protein
MWLAIYGNLASTEIKVYKEVHRRGRFTELPK